MYKLKTKLYSYATGLHSLITVVLASNKFFLVAVGLFILGSGWIALSASFPLIFDENYHLGVIDIYSRQLSPFIYNQPDDAKYYGDITRDPSYLYHYLMSFPYRILGWFTDDIVTKIVTLRFINIGFVALSLVYWRRLIRRLGLGPAGANIVVFFFTIVPLVPYVAAHINYDNLVLLLMPILLLAVLKLVDTKHSLAYLLIAAGTAGVLGIVKFSTLPIVFSAAIASVAILIWRYRRKLLSGLRSSLAVTKKPLLIGAAILALAGVGLFAERYGVNYIEFGSHSPDCADIHSYDECAENSVWIRNYNAKQRAANLDRTQLWSPYEFSVNRWFPHIFSDLFVVGAFADASTDVHRFMPQQLMASSGSKTARYVSAVMFTVGLIAVALAWRRFPSPVAKYLLVGTFLIYSASLWITNYSMYYDLGRIYATQGRYMIPFIIPVVAAIVLAFSLLFRKRLAFVGSLLLVVFMIAFLPAAGALTYIVYSQPNWQWGLGSFREWTAALRDVLKPLLKG